MLEAPEERLHALLARDARNRQVESVIDALERIVK